MDSGYNTTSVGAASLIDGLSSVSNGKESFSSNPPLEEPFPFPRLPKLKVEATGWSELNILSLEL